jgi:hypothetical protein
MATKRLKRPRDPVQLAKLIGDIATGQVEDKPAGRISDATIERAVKAGKVGGKRRAAALTPEQRSDISRLAAEARWKKSS